MEQRKFPWRDQPSDLVRSRLNLVGTSRLLLLQERGPTAFIIGESGDRKRQRRKFNVFIGARQSCSCTDGAELCVHILFVMVKVLRVPLDQPLVWQRSLLDVEIALILQGHFRTRACVPREIRKPAHVKVTARIIDADDTCPICQDVLADGNPCTSSVHISRDALRPCLMAI